MEPLLGHKRETQLCGDWALDGYWIDNHCCDSSCFLHQIQKHVCHYENTEYSKHKYMFVNTANDYMSVYV